MLIMGITGPKIPHESCSHVLVLGLSLPQQEIFHLPWVFRDSVTGVLLPLYLFITGLLHKHFYF